MAERKPTGEVDTQSLPVGETAYDVNEATESLFDLLSDSGKDVEAFDVDEDEAGNRDDNSDKSGEEESDDHRDEEEEEDDEEDERRDEESDDDEDDEEKESEANDQVVTYKVKVDGQEIEVTQDELLRGYSRTQDYTRKTQDLAERRKAFESEAAAVAQERAQYTERLNLLEQAIRATQPAEPNWDQLRQKDPVRFAAEWAEHQRRQEALRAIEQEREATHMREAQDQQARFSEHLQLERQRLIEAIPEWADEAKAREEKANLANYAKSAYGYTDEDLDAVADHRIMVILRKAEAYDRLQEGKGKLAEKRATAKVLKPGTQETAKKRSKPKLSKRGQRARQRLSQGGSVQDAAAVLFETIGDDF